MTRAVHLTDDEFNQLHRADHDDPPLADRVIHVDAMTPSEQLAAILHVWDGSSHAMQ